MSHLEQAGAVLELRQYTLHPGRRDALIELFEREFVHTQRACGIRLPGQFRDLDRPDRFVWLRGFADLAERALALAEFYDGPAWRAHRDAANATMIDSDDVLLLRPLPGGVAAAATGAGGIAVLGICRFETPQQVTRFAAGFAAEVEPLLAEQGAVVLVRWRSDPALVNDFPRLPVREGEQVLAWLARHPEGLRQPERLRAALRPQLIAEAQLLRLAPTAGSALQL